MGDISIKINDNSPPSATPPDRSFPSTSRKETTRRKGVLFANVTLMVGAAAVLCVLAIGFLSSLYTTSRGVSQSKAGQVMTSEDDGQSEALHIEKRETEATTQQGACLEEFCLTEECVHAASNLLNFMDDSVDPCDDFYRYACGGWIKKNEHEVAGDNFVYSVATNVLSDSIDTSLKELLRTGGNVPTEVLQTKPYEDLFLFYTSCKEVEHDTQDMSAVHDVLQNLDQFQVGKPFEPSSWDLTRALLQLFRINGAPLFDIVVDSDVQRVGKFAILITSPRHFGLISRLKRNSNRRRSQGLQEFLRESGRRVLFGDVVDDAALQEAMIGARAGLSRHPSQKVAAGLDINLVSADDAKKQQVGTATPPQKTSTSLLQTPTHLPTTTTTTSTTILRTTSQPLTTTNVTKPYTDLPSTITTTSTTSEESATEDDYASMEQFAVSRRIVYSIFKEDTNAKRLESLAATLHDTFPNAAVAPSSSSSPDGDVPDDVYHELMTRFLPILQELLPSEREELETQQKGDQYNHFTISLLQQRCPVIDWSLLLGELFNATITDQHNIYIHYPEHLTKLCTLLDNTEPWVIHYALLTLYAYDVLQETVYATEGIDRDDFCLQAVKGVFGEVMSNLYLHHIGNSTLEDIRGTTSSIMEVLREEVEETLAAATWLGEEDKERALEKLHTMGVKIGAKDTHWDITFVNKSHEGLSFPSNASFLHTVLELYRTFRHQLYQLHPTTLDNDDFIWSFTVQPYVVNAFYAADLNTIVFPEAFYHPPYHRHHAPNYLNYGSTTTSIAHEIFHALDFLGIQFDQNGLLARPFSEEMLSHLKATADCYHALLSDAFYEEVYVPHTLIAFEIDDVITKNENLADISGLRAAFRSYRRWEEREGVEPRLPALPLTPHQLFFVSAAQPYCSITTRVGDIFLMELDEHLPNKIRINGMMKNLPEFAHTFNCSSTSKMFSANTCQLF